jgi:putative nucleotidyltransferase with HDIG domain
MRMNNPRILIFGDKEKSLQTLAVFLKELDLLTVVAPELPVPQGPEGRNPGISAILMAATDLKEPNLERIRKIRKIDGPLPVIALSKPAESLSLIGLLHKGVIDQIASPDNPAGVYSAIRSALAQRQISLENEAYQTDLMKLKKEHSRDIRKALELEEIYDTTLENLMTALDLRDVETFGHSQTVAKYSQVLAGLLGIHDKKTLDNIRKGALLHDVGKIAIPDSILKKPGRLTPQEWEKIRLHPSLGYGLVKEIKLVKEAGNIILHHHEKYDGTGYPEGLKESEIPVVARIFALADALDAITSHRPYRQERDFRTAKDEIQEHVGTQFDPDVFDAFEELPLDKWEKIRFETTRLLPGFIDYHRLALKK